MTNSTYHTINGTEINGTTRDFPSTFTSGWAAIKAILLLGESKGEEFANQTIIFSYYYNWLRNHQTSFGLFGNPTVESNYWGLSTMDLFENENCYNDFIFI